MGRQAKRLTARTVATLKTPGRHSDGGNLYLSISKTAAGLSKRWTFMYAIGGRQREAGLGSAAVVSLAEARKAAGEWRSQLAKGIDPLDARKAAEEAKDAKDARRTFGECAAELIQSKRSGWRNAAHATQWVTTLDIYCEAINDKPVDAIDTQAVLAVLTPIWQTKHVTAQRLRGRIEAVLNYAKAHKLRSGENPAQWRGHLELLLSKRPKLDRGHHAAMPYDRVPAFVAELRKVDSVAALALEFTILTACRSGEVRGAQWNEIDLEARIWTIPDKRMKAGIPHRVPLSSRAVAIIETLAAYRTCDFIFFGQRRGQPIGKTAMSMLVPTDTTVHGFRSSFRDWCGEETSFPREIAEASLAHATGDSTEQAYRRGDALEKRRQLMQAWAQFCEPAAGSNVIALRS
jgi:integrase